MYQATIQVKFEAAHRLFNYEGKCRNLHGHSYVATVVVSSPKLEERSPGFVVDFGVLKRIVKDWIDANWDHATLLNEQDPMCGWLTGESHLFIMGEDPTAEHMTELLYRILSAAFHHRKSLEVSQVTIQETETAWATYRP